MTKMFKDCNKLENLNITDLAPDIVQFMPEMFSECHSLTSLDLSQFKTGNVVDMTKLFYNTKKLAYLNLKNFDTTDLDKDKTTDMFYNINDGNGMEIVVDLEKCKAFDGIIPKNANITKPDSSFE